MSAHDPWSQPTYNQVNPYGSPRENALYDQPYLYPAAAPSAPPRPNNTLALVSMILSLVGLASGVTAIGGIVCGHIARRQIRQTGEAGDGMALTGLIVGYVVVAGWTVYVALVILYMIFVLGMAGVAATS